MRKFILLSGTAVLFASASPASAQTESQTEDDQYSGDVIVVTALKREQSITEVPTGISVLGGQELEERGIETIQDLSFAVPGLTMREDGPGSYTIFLRGLVPAIAPIPPAADGRHDAAKDGASRAGLQARTPGRRSKRQRDQQSRPVITFHS